MAAALRREWIAINQWTIQRLIFSMRRRCTAFIQANRGMGPELIGCLLFE